MSIFDCFAKIEEQRRQNAAANGVSYMVVGLGNPGAEYEKTRHNAGFRALDAIAKEFGAAADRAKFDGLCGRCVIENKGVLLLKPMTYMNCSGLSVVKAANYYKLLPRQILVLSDDVTLDLGRMRLRRCGSDGGQKGLRSIIEGLGTDAFPRLRIGVGKKPTPEYPMADFVLGRLSPAQLQTVADREADLLAGVRAVIRGAFDEAVAIVNAGGKA